MSCFSIYRMEAKPASDMSSTSASGDKGDEGFSIPSSIRAANETAAKVEVRTMLLQYDVFFVHPKMCRVDFQQTCKCFSCFCDCFLNP